MRPDPVPSNPRGTGRSVRRPPDQGLFPGGVRAAVLPKWQRGTNLNQRLQAWKFAIFHVCCWFSVAQGRVARHLLSTGEPV